MKAYVTQGPVRISDISDLIAKGGSFADAGGHSLFIGQVRADVSDNKRVAAIEYSVFEEMAHVEADRITKMVMAEFSDVKSVEIIHSAGIVKAGEISLFVMVSAGHRHQAAEACSRTVELIKERFPAWKKEILEDGSEFWKEVK